MVFIASRAEAESVHTSTTTVATSEEQALSIAKSAFEYRDFELVITTLNHWVHPPRIKDIQKMIEARRLLGVSFYVQGDKASAEEEFAQLLLLDPDHKLDPFVFPPQIISTFENIHQKMWPREKHNKRALMPEEINRPVEVPHPSMVWLPFGVPQFVLKKTNVGILLGAAQFLGLALNVVAFFRGQDLRRRPSLETSQAEEDLWLAAQYSGLALFGIAYGGSVAHGYLNLDDTREIEQSLSTRPQLPLFRGARIKLSF